MFQKRFFHWYFLVCLVAADAFIWQAVFVHERNVLTVAFLDIGQGDAIFIESPNGNQMLIDGGRTKKVLRELADAMPFHDRTIDVVIATHPDSDHIGGLVDVLKSFDVHFFLVSGARSDTGFERSLESVAEEKNIPRLLARRGMNIALGRGAHFEILFPDRDVSDFETNDASIVGILRYGGTSFYLSGDSPQRIEKYLVGEYGDKLKVTVLKLGHHGSRTSTSEALLAAASPEYAVAQVGKDNPYGHPHQEVLDLLARFGIPLLRNDEDGRIVFKSDGETLRREK
jgi:competence protein ComEC